MEIKTIDFYDEFKCIGGKCPYTCCAGWAIAVDDETYDNYKKEPGLKGKALLGLTKSNSYGIRTIRNLLNHCPYHTLDGLCAHQKNKRTNLMPYACRHYPRRSVSYGDYAEVTLELSCIKVAQIFVKNPGRRELISRGVVQERYNTHNYNYICTNKLPLPQELAEEKIMWEMGNNAPKFLEAVNRDREQIIDYIWKNKANFIDVVRDIYEFAYMKNFILSQDNLQKASELKLPLYNASDETDKESNTLIGVEYNIPKISKREKGYAFYPLWFVNKLIYQKLLRDDFKSENKFMRKLIKDYEGCFGELTEAKADKYFNDQIERLFEANMRLKELFISYYSYLLQQSYCESYEDYYVLGPVMLTMVQLQFLMEFFVSEFVAGKEIDDELAAEIIANTEKTIRHNLHFNDYILKEIRKVFF